MEMVEVESIHISSLYITRQQTHGQSYKTSQVRTHSHGQRAMQEIDTSM